MLDLTPDICDRWPDDCILLPVNFNQYGGRKIFHGEVVTVKCFEDNSRVKELLAGPGDGKVLVVDGGGACRRALLGDLIGESAVKYRWAGVVIFGAIRDAGTLATLELGVQALGTVPFKTDRKGLGEINVPIDIGGVTVSPGMYLYADSNGILVSNCELDLSELS
ncbi:putative 4-hydroxy-4-methyl-2-oxoglutarate aldolase [Shewanella corallii]|uniref:4-hydroxy-4-methyl-2-oxoglutarate aldolase n=1 Tax=Shewanella corallii TaxID=560080 RepID=A0ABT0N8R4_9GAMM|nr:putative 4-hydroxy-4-methyl-2-oxoglutarate aldolase [Shewanella corallii]MCL2914878.1 putative 4-hydroxy-4-methyl-2-oxoglutarate aldolase [Shewanella corallii]